MPGMNGDETAERALRLRPELKIITLSMFGDENYYTRMVEAGARGFLLKDSSFEEVLRAVETVQGGGSYFSEGLLASLAHRMRTREGALRLFFAAAAAGFRGGVFPRASCPQGARRRFGLRPDRRAADGLWHE